MPKVELHVRLEGAVANDVILTIAEQNEAQEGLKHFNTWVGLLQKPDYDRMDEIIKVVSQWVRVGEDLSRMVYYLATDLAKQNVRYAEVTVNPALYGEVSLALEQFFAALNDGRERAERAWGIKIGWLVGIPREEPRRADEYVRYAQSAGGRKAGIVGVSLVGRETAQPVGQFERALSAAEKKGIPLAVTAGDYEGAEGIQKAVDALRPARIDVGWRLSESAELMKLLQDTDTAVTLSPARALRTKKIAAYGEYPLRALYDDGVRVVLSSDMPVFFDTTLNEQYTIAATELDFNVDELDDLALNGVRASFLPDDEKAAMLEQFEEAYAALRAEHLEAQAE